jgi:micrococcal nuclease
MKLFSLLFLMAALPAYAQAVVTGACLVIDGDTINVINGDNTTKVRLRGIAAPEIDQFGGKEATAFLEKFAEGKPVQCVLDAPKIKQFDIGTCYVRGQDIAAAVVKAGWARDCTRLSGGKYRNLERPEAKKLFFPDYCKK